MKKIDPTQLVATRLRALRTDHGWSQAELGERIGLSRSTASTRVNRYEQGVHVPDLVTAKAMATELGVDLAYLFAEDQRLADFIKIFSRLSDEERNTLISKVTNDISWTEHQKDAD